MGSLIYGDDELVYAKLPRKAPVTSFVGARTANRHR